MPTLTAVWSCRQSPSGAVCPAVRITTALHSSRVVGGYERRRMVSGLILYSWKHQHLNSYKCICFTFRYPSFDFLPLPMGPGCIEAAGWVKRPGHPSLQPRPSGPEAVPGQIGYVVPPACSGSALGLLPVGRAQSISKRKCARQSEPRHPAKEPNFWFISSIYSFCHGLAPWAWNISTGKLTC